MYDIKMLKAIQKIIDKAKFDFKYIDLGGGMGINYGENKQNVRTVSKVIHKLPINLKNELYLVVLSSLVLIIFVLISNYGNRVNKDKTLNVLSTLSISGYAIPGVILAVAFITFIAWIDESVIKTYGFLSIKKVFIGSILGLVIVYFIRFYSLAFNGIKSGYEKINISVDESSYLLGYSKRKTFMNIHIPFLRNSLLFVFILISLEIIRELPITLILRPFNFETFATTAYISASEDLLEAAAVPSLFLILIATSFIIVTSKYILRDQNE